MLDSVSHHKRKLSCSNKVARSTVRIARENGNLLDVRYFYNTHTTYLAIGVLFLSHLLDHRTVQYTSMAGKVFGIDLQTLVQQQKVDVPTLVTHVVEFLISREGLS